MRSVEVNTTVPATKGLTELNHHKQAELKEVKDRAAFNGQRLCEEDESRINEDINGRRIELVQVQDVPQGQQQQPQGVVQWEQFLPFRSLKVLLVENDDSTRHVVSALLRNCSYEVTAVENGLEAWKVLVDLTIHIDLVLTEVVMPYLSGVGLLSKIMSHITCKNIPVIMMSSDDSMGIVFNCLSKGAVDFLVKPIRKNELKNLWQHVWRKCHSSSGSGSESGIRTRKSTKSRSIEGSDNGTGSNDEDDNRSIDFTAKGGSDNGSGTQNSWSKRAIEVDSSQAISPWDQLADPPDSTCAQVIYTKPEAFRNYWAPMTTTWVCGREDDKLDTGAMGKDLEIGFPINPGLELQDPSKEVTHSVACMNKDKFSESNAKKVDEKSENGRLELVCETENCELRIEAADLMGTINKRTSTQIETVANGASTSIKDKNIYHSKELPVLELSLKRPRDVRDTETSNQERNVLRHSDLSAFSRYNTTSNANQAPTGNVGSCSPLDTSSEAAKAESTQNIHSNWNGTPNQRSNGSSNNDDMGSTTNNAFIRPEAVGDNKPIARSTTVNIHTCSAFQSIHEDHHDHTSSLEPNMPSTVDGATVNTVLTQPRAPHQQVQVRHHHHHYHHHHHHVHNLQEQQKMDKQDDGSLRNTVSNVLTATEGNAANYGSASGSNNKSNGEDGSSGQKGSSSAAMAEGPKMRSDNGVIGKCEAADGSGGGSGRGSGVDQNRLAQREAALNKFRQKRKERCFEKKVRYQSRKRLAEQRPRVRGQFVRQGVHENKNEDADS